MSILGHYVRGALKMCEITYLDKLPIEEKIAEAYLLLKRNKHLTDTLNKFATLYCDMCKLYFRVDKTFEGVITCPYCGVYIEG